MWRQELGDFCSITCFKAAIAGMEDALGQQAAAIALTTAGRARGKQLIKDLGWSGQLIDFDVLTDKMRFALGKEGSRFCLVEKISQAEGIITVYTSETLCSAGEQPGSSRQCTFTLGAVWGALEELMGQRFQAQQTVSVLKGGSFDVFEFTPT